MKKIKMMIADVATKIEAINMLNTMQNYGDINQNQYDKGRKLINKEFNK